MRKAITFLQNLSYMNKYNKGAIMPSDVYDAANCIKKSHLDIIWNICVRNKKTGIKDVLSLTQKVRAKGYPIHSIFSGLSKIIINTTDISDKQKAVICMEISKSEKQIIDGADEYLQLLHILSSLKMVTLS
jgi:replication factor C subunit 2/4